MHTPKRSWVASLMVAVFATAGCHQAHNTGDIRAREAPTLIPAMVNAADHAQQSDLDELVHALSDEDAAVRLFAIQVLYQQTQETFGYRYYDPPDARRTSIRRWQRWVTSRPAQTVSTSTQEPTQP